MTIKVAINGFGRMGRLAFRAAWDWPEFEIVHINEISGDAAAAAHLLNFDSVHGRWSHRVDSDEKNLIINGQTISYSQNKAIEATPWQALGVDIVVECTGKFKAKEVLAAYLEQGVKKVVVSAPVKDGTLNIVMGVNDDLYQPELHDIVTAASCTTNCIAPVVKVIHENFVIKHGSMTTIHDITNTQSILDEYHPDLRRARASGLSLIPTTTGSATAITEIFPELKGKLNGIAVRVPLANASLTDCVFEVEQSVTVEEVNTVLKAAAEGELNGILGYETLPLVSADYTNDTHSSTIDALSTMVINGTQVKLLAWYDNEIGYVHRMMELTKKLAIML
ncbi:MAG: ArsJ-associated glyceraldehyde-3-phosphate dehydrogenase [Methyloprofundus sp.]|nr:ArsJ-associated glyceraldehyde-3-phosphate dehydrogenase [Methyloprofundus sp.]